MFCENYYRKINFSKFGFSGVKYLKDLRFAALFMRDDTPGAPDGCAIGAHDQDGERARRHRRFAKTP